MPLAWLGALAIGLSLGLLGSGGSILTVPVLVYFVGRAEKPAIAESLAIVGLIAAAGAIPFIRSKLVVWRSVLVFGVPGMLGSYGGAAVSAYVSGAVQLALFALIMLVASVFMLRPPRLLDGGQERAVWKIALDGLVVGLITGLVGVGGGFLIVPALVLLGGLSVHRAVGTSLTIIAMKSLTGFFKYVDVLADLGLTVDWGLIATMSVVGVFGSFAGNRLGARLSRDTLRRAFGVFLIVMGAWILYEKLPGLLFAS